MQSSSNFSLETWLQRQFLSSLLSTPEGRAWPIRCGC